MNRSVGLELEMIGLTAHQFSHRHRQIYDGSYNLDLGGVRCSVGYDGSIQSPESLELRTKPFKELKVVPKIVKACKDAGLKGVAAYKCGMHIHVDFNPDLRDGYRQVLANRFNDKWYPKMMREYRIHKKRAYYCNGGSAAIYTRYSAVNFTSEYPTIEFRLFNCVVDTRYICRAIHNALMIADDLEDYAKSFSRTPSSFAQFHMGGSQQSSQAYSSM